MKVLTVNITSTVHEGEWTGSEGKTGIDKRSKIRSITQVPQLSHSYREWSQKILES